LDSILLEDWIASFFERALVVSNGVLNSGVLPHRDRRVAHSKRVLILGVVVQIVDCGRIQRLEVPRSILKVRKLRRSNDHAFVFLFELTFFWASFVSLLEEAPRVFFKV